jgi:hypothetical protein
MARLTFSVAAVLFALAVPAWAQAPPPSLPSGVTIYDQKFFAQYGVVTARDMLERIPGMGQILAGFAQRGFQTQEQQDRRGMRSDTDQLLINGRRTTSKEGDATDFLERIAAAQVERIEVITGNVKEIDATVSGRVVNIVLKGGEQGSSSGAYVVGFSYTTAGPIKPVNQLSYNFERGGFSFTAGLENRPMTFNQKVNDVIRSPAGAQTGRFFENRARFNMEYVGRLRTGYSWANGASVQLAALGTYVPKKERDTSESFGGAGAVETRLFNIQDRTDGHDLKTEVSVDVGVPLGSSIKALLLGVYSRGEIDLDSETFDIVRSPSVRTGGDTRDEVKTAKIVRLTLQGTISDNHQVEIGAEGANTRLDKDLDFFSFAGATRIDIPVFNSDTMINEDRAEVFSTYTWKAGQIEFEPGVAAEFSKLRQRGRDANVTRTFSFVKPSVNIWYNPAPGSRWFLSAVRDVGQLTFEDFAASFLREDNEVVAGNPNLVPEKAWVFELGVEHRLGRDAGVLQAKGFYRRISDVNDEVPLGPGISGPGNLGKGFTYGTRLEWSFKLNRLNLFDGVLGGSLTLQDSEVTDAFTGRTRRIGRQPEYEAAFNFRQDITAWGLAYGIEYTKNGANIESDFTRFDRRVTARGDSRVFLEKTLFAGVIGRWFVGNVITQRPLRNRIVYAVSQSDGRVLRTERRQEDSNVFIGFRFRGGF